MNKRKQILLGLICLSAVFAVLHSLVSRTKYGFRKASNWSNENAVISISKKNPNSTTRAGSASQSIPSLRPDNAIYHIPVTVADDVGTTTMPTTLESDFTTGSPWTSYSADALKTTKSIKYAQPRNYSYTLPRELRQVMKHRFLFPVVLFGGGPNFQFRQLKTSLEFAVFTNRTIVLSDFRHHRSKYNVSSVHFEETFNISLLNKFMPAVNVKQFREKCGSSVNTVWTFYHPRRSSSSSIADVYQGSRDWLRERANVDIPDVKSVTFPNSISESWRAIEKTADEQCVVMVSPLAFERVALPNEAVVSDAIDGHLARTSFLQKAVEDVLPRMCDGKAILAFHWRNKTGEQCRVGKISHKNDPRCRKLLQMQHRILESLASHISSIMSQENAGCIFMASAPREPRENILRLFTSHNLTNVIMIDDVINLHNPDFDTFADNDYFVSLSEQEICARSKVFIGIGKSNWSTFVFRERRAFQRGKNYDVITDFPDLSGIAQQYL
ncbi:uncharacterized protein [Ptychodera flava]|uniref:uncharacterized protein n=1 Tax=Ptychodera flava TaxID=63121 RepID=UPI003969D4AB